ncbi:hypothetical protein BGZ83_009784 [Gryganskiella cystojenkinii]|nr:hypothetical protein BGZ83_009784 [Gryganskiella cystojenkinii]
MNSDLRASLLNCGFTLRQARAAIEAGHTTVDAATEWIFDNNAAIDANTSSSSSTLRLRDDTDNAFEADLQRALAASAAQVQPHSSEDPFPESVLPTFTSTNNEDQETANTAKKIKINIIKNPAPPSSQPQVIPPLPLSSRFNDEALDAQNASRLLEANRRAEKIKKEKAQERLARQRALNAFKEDQEARKSKNQALSNTSSSAAGPSTSNTSIPGAFPPTSAATVPVPSTSSATTHSSTTRPTMVQIRLKNGSVLKRSMDCTSTLKDLFEIARTEDGNLGNADITLIQPFPRREFTAIESSLTLTEAGLYPSCSLNVSVPPPIVAPQPLTPGAWLPDDIEMEESLTNNNDDGSLVDQEHILESHDEEDNEDIQDDVQENDQDQEHEVSDDGDEDEEIEEDNPMHAMPIIGHHPQAGNNFAGRGRGRGRGGMAFSGAGHSLGSSSTSSAPVVQPDAEASIADQGGAIRRQRILDAMAARERDQATAVPEEAQAPKKIKTRDVPTLQSLCSYEVAVLLTSRNSASSKHLKLLGDNLGSQSAESIIQELIKLKQLDQLSFKRFFKCSLVNIVLDGYSRATDSLLDAIGSCQSRSLMYLSLKSCAFLTDAGFSNVARFEELEFLDLSHCRITDKTLEFTLNLPNLSALHLSTTKITSRGLAKVIADAAWNTTLQTLDVSFCEGIMGRTALSNLQGLTNLQTLRLNNTNAFNESGIVLPEAGAFTQLLNLDIAWTTISSADVVALAGFLSTLETLNLTSCGHVDASALEHCVTSLRDLQTLRFPNREHDLLTVLPLAASLPLVELDLSKFLFVADEAILALEAAHHLQMLSLADTRLTDVGAAVFVHLSSLKELSLDRTAISDKAIDYLRDLARIEILSMARCGRLTTVGMNSLGRCAFFTLNLKRLNLGYNPFIHDESLAVFTRGLELTTLNLEYTDVTESKAWRLQNSLPHLTQLRIQGVTNGAVYEENPRALPR